MGLAVQLVRFIHPQHFSTLKQLKSNVIFRAGFDSIRHGIPALVVLCDQDPAVFDDADVCYLQRRIKLVIVGLAVQTVCVSLAPVTDVGRVRLRSNLAVLIPLDLIRRRLHLHGHGDEFVRSVAQP